MEIAAAMTLGMAIAFVGGCIVYWLREISEGVKLLRYAVEDKEHTEPACPVCELPCWRCTAPEGEKGKG